MFYLDPYQYQIPSQPPQQHDFQVTTAIYLLSIILTYLKHSMNPKWTEPGVIQADYPATYPENVIIEQPIPYLYWYGAATTIKEKSTFLLFFIVVLASFCGVCGCLGGLICLIPAAVMASLVRLTH